ncbi:MAG: flagellar type III secretion system pore protein FliP [Planctomycetes bacterium]|nr:flagellar type III secretion system pore protein FliP [Planctomycetota bacterium]
MTRTLGILAAVLVLAGLAAAQGTQGPLPAGGAAAPAISVQIGGGDEPRTLGTAVEIFLFMTLLSLAPAIVMTMTCFTRIVIVLSFLKRAMAMQELPPAPVVTGFALFLSIFLMQPVAKDVYEQAYRPYVDGELGFEQAAGNAGDRVTAFMIRQTRVEDVELILSLARTAPPATPQEVPFHVAVPAFILSEVKTAFQMGFVIFLPFVVIDLVISAILVSMGMFTLPPVVISTPLKLLLFVLVDGWNLVVVSLAESFRNA